MILFAKAILLFSRSILTSSIAWSMDYALLNSVGNALCELVLPYRRILEGLDGVLPALLFCSPRGRPFENTRHRLLLAADLL